ncbi:polyketide cyclase/dehydrase/lipid transport protein [Agromyces ramosus]|uniref:Polyketide cyclase/dehydrase/lipid transport protein n=1 Tax=Agromyces ramosus TaxID=33879 RepID=A0A4Q7MJ13_9MICO|nr:SRPBCC family protein [Agromyces ramosus]RZS68345.1 polyketide cyclase/dehydrase/lipid transport protein [Agromyces ramosus]
MKVIECSTEIARAPQEVFDYVTDAARLPEWQPSVEEASAEPPAIRKVGMRGWEVRRVPGGSQKARWQVTGCEPGSRWAVEGIDGPVRAHVDISFVPTDGGTHVDYRVWFEGRGIGKLIRMMATHGAGAEMPASLALLKQRLELVDA